MSKLPVRSKEQGTAHQETAGQTQVQADPVPGDDLVADDGNTVISIDIVKHRNRNRNQRRSVWYDGCGGIPLLCAGVLHQPM